MVRHSGRFLKVNESAIGVVFRGSPKSGEIQSISVIGGAFYQLRTVARSILFSFCMLPFRKAGDRRRVGMLSHDVFSGGENMKSSSYLKVPKRWILAGIVMLFMAAAVADNVAAQMKEWDYVVLGDSQSSGLSLLYAKGLEQDLGVKINILNRTVGGQSTMTLLRELRGNRDLQDTLRKAKVVTLNVPMAVFGYAMSIFRDGKCGGADSQDCLREALKTYQEETTGIFAELISLSHPSKVLIRTMDTPQFMTRTTKARGRFQVLKPYWQAANKCVIEVATKHRIPVARVYSAFMGPNGDDDPQDKGLMSSDEIHPTPQGNDLIAKLFRELKYQYATP